MKKQKKREINKRRILIEVICISVIAVFAAVRLSHRTPMILEYLMHDDIDGLTSYIRGEGQLGEVILIGLQVLETLSIVLPALPVYICAGIIFGKLEGILICYLTNLVLNAIMFTFARRGGRSLGDRKLSEKNSSQKTRKIIQYVTNMPNPDRALLFLYLVPVIPNGLIPTIAAQTKIKFSHFIGELAVCCLPGIAVSVICGDALLTVHWHFSLPLLILIAVAAILVFIFKKPISAWLEKKIGAVKEKLEEEEK